MPFRRTDVLYSAASFPTAVPRRLIRSRSLLHGMISLYNSRLAVYVAEDIPMIYSRTIDQLTDMIEPL